MRGLVSVTIVEVRTRGERSTVDLNCEQMHSAKVACRRLEVSERLRLTTQGDSAVRLLHNHEVDHSFELEFK
jgi:hypothetical protein